MGAKWGILPGALGALGSAVVAFGAAAEPDPVPQLVADSFVLEAQNRFGDASQIEASYSQSPRVSEDQILIVAFTLGRLSLSEGTPALLIGGSLRLPLGELSRLLEFPIEVDARAGTAKGWFIREANSFALDLAQGEISVAGARVSFDRALVTSFEGDLFVDMRLLANWLSLTFKPNLAGLLVVIESDEVLPVQERINREGRHAKLAAVKTEDQNYPAAASRRRAFGIPFADFSADYSYNTSPGGTTSFLRSDLLLNGDVVFMDGNMFVSANNHDGITQVRFTLTRKDPNGIFKNGGGFNLTEVSLGDVFTPQIPLISRVQLGRGITFSNMPLDQPTEFDRLTLTGDLPVGWEVELYRNEVLLEFQTPSSAGQYHFEDVPLLFGTNRIRLVFYGPQGQVREEVRDVRVGLDQIEPGKHRFRFSANQQGELLLVEKTGFFSDSFLDTPADGEPRVLAEYFYGVSRHLAFGANYSLITTSDGIQRNYAGINLLSSLGPVFGRLDFVKDFNGGWAGRISAQVPLGARAQLFLEQTRLNDFFSEQFESAGGTLENRSEVRVDGFLTALKNRTLSYSFRALHDRFATGDTQTRLSSQMSTFVYPLSITHTLNIDWFTSGGITRTTVNGSLLLGAYLGNLRLRGQINYQDSGGFSLSSTTVTADLIVSRMLAARAYTSIDLTGTGNDVFGVGLSTNPQNSPVNVGVGVQYQTNHDWQIRLNVAFSLGIDPRGNDVKLLRPGRGALGAVSARAFVDRNLNGVFDAGDEPLEGVGFKVGRGLAREVTNASGAAFLQGLPVYREQAIAVIPETVDDPYVIPREEAYRVMPRPGVTTLIDFAFVETGEIDGTVSRREGDVLRPLAGVALELVDASGRIVKTVKTAFDGFYLFDLVPPGRYRVRIADKDLARLGVTGVDPRAFVVGGGRENIVSGADFVLMH